MAKHNKPTAKEIIKNRASVNQSKRYRYRALFKHYRLKRAATDLLYNKMVHYDEQAKRILNAVLAELRKKDKSDGKSIVHAMKLIQDADKIAIECAVKLAPFQAPTLKSVEVKQKTETRYVVRTPEKIKDGEDWLSRTGHKSSENTGLKLDPIPIPSRLTVNDLIEMDEEQEQQDIEDQRNTLRH